jgi:hypothetical protein
VSHGRDGDTGGASDRAAPSQQPRDVLLRLLGEREGRLSRRSSEVCDLAARTAARLGRSPHEIEAIRLGAGYADGLAGDEIRSARGSSP